MTDNIKVCAKTGRLFNGDDRGFKAEPHKVKWLDARIYAPAPHSARYLCLTVNKRDITWSSIKLCTWSPEDGYTSGNWKTDEGDTVLYWIDGAFEVPAGVRAPRGSLQAHFGF